MNGHFPIIFFVKLSDKNTIHLYMVHSNRPNTWRYKGTALYLTMYLQCKRVMQKVLCIVAKKGYTLMCYIHIIAAKGLIMAG